VPAKFECKNKGWEARNLVLIKLRTRLC